MELRDLNAFVTVVDTGGFSRAADRLHLVQSAVSMAVKRLEREVDLVLLERRPGGAAPTRPARRSPTTGGSSSTPSSALART
jgi:DNA-binding transcriptional LysR family regulator